MATLNSVLKNLFPFQGYKPTVLENGERLLIGLTTRRKHGLCPDCKKHTTRTETIYSREVRDCNIVGKQCFLQIPIRKIACRCGYRGVEWLDFVESSHRVTNRMETYVATLSELMTLSDVAVITKLDWKTIKEIDKAYIKKLLPKIEQLSLRRLAIDEIAIQKGHKYASIIRDYDTGVVIKIVVGRAYNEVLAALLTLGKERLKEVMFVSMDMWDPFIKAITELCPQAKIIFDKFHVVKKLNEALDEVRKQEFANAAPEEKKMMKHKRFIILKKEENLDKEEREQLKNIMNKNETLFKAYLIKEQLITIFDDKKSSFEQIQTRLQQWMENIYSNNLTTFFSVVNTIQAHLQGVLNYFRYNMTNAIAEGFNTKINIIKRRAYGFKDTEYFMLKIFQSTLHRLT
jgi:transposase